MRWLSRLLRRRQLDRELDAELRHHVEEDTRRLITEGVAPSEARRRALAAFGGIEPIREVALDARGTRWLDDLGRDLRYALRLMKRSPVFTLAAVGSLAIGIGANAAIFSVIDALLLKSLPVDRPHDLYFLEKAGLDQPTHRFSYLRLQAFARDVAGVRFAGMSAPGRMQIRRDEGAEMVIGQLVTGAWFEVAGLKPQAGTFFTAADDEGAGRPVVVLSDSYWTRQFAREPSIVGRPINLNGHVLTVVGIAPPGFLGLTVGERIDLWAPTAQQQPLRWYSNASMEDSDDTKPWNPQDGIQWLTAIARVPTGANLSTTEARTTALYRRHREGQLASAPAAVRDYRLREHVVFRPGARGLSPLRESFTGALNILMATVALVLLVACANLANLLLARDAARGREISVRLAIGARRGRLVRQLLTESLLLAVAGGLAGLAVAAWGGRMLLRLASTGSAAVPLVLPMDIRLIGFAAAVSVLTGVLFGLAPALRWSRADVLQVLRGASRVVGGVPRFGKGLVVIQVALALLLLIGAALFTQTFRNYLALDPGFAREHVLSARIDPRLSGVPEDRLPTMNDRLLAEALRIPGVRSATLAMSGPATGSQRISGVFAEGHTPEVSGNDSVQEDFVGPAYFETVAMRLVSGRDFTERDDARALKVAIVNEAMARHYFPGQNPVGKRYGYSADNLNFEIVGVVADARVNGLRQPVPAFAYHPVKQHPTENVRNVYVRATGAPASVRSALRAAVTAAEPLLAVREVVTLAELTERTIVRERLVSNLVGTFSLMALAVACLGLYGMVSYSVARRRNELGVRLALGATPARVRWLVVKESCVLVGVGCLAGLLAAWPVLGSVSTLLYGLSPRDPATLAGATGILLVVGLLAALVPAWRASRLDPLRALRVD